MADLERFDAEELLCLARLDIEKERFDSALAKLKAAYGMAPAPGPIALALARLYAQIGLLAKARALMAGYVSARPDDLDALFQLGMMNHDIGDRSEALACWEATLDREPHHPPALFYSAAVMADLGRQADATRRVETLLANVDGDNFYYKKGQELRDSLGAPASMPSPERLQ